MIANIDEARKLVEQKQQLEQAERFVTEYDRQQRQAAQQQAAQEKAIADRERVDREFQEFEAKRHEAEITLRALTAQVKGWIEDTRQLKAESGVLFEHVREMLKNGDPNAFVDDGTVREEYRRRLQRKAPLLPQFGWHPLYFTYVEGVDQLFTQLLETIANMGNAEFDRKPSQPARYPVVGSNGRQTIELDYR